ncbi:Cullin family protein [Histomonas meleagridis]|uniref:Cullin family protein n=1 Tax=Histomonas meleagridis TaxID=135588 RepID=UPI0035596248|nr:Cullin family protein [Histomonas meleagridis]KAH0801327.1 Cullin family protein [Histomonas meleagridis]
MRQSQFMTENFQNDFENPPNLPIGNGSERILVGLTVKQNSSNTLLPCPLKIQQIPSIEQIAGLIENTLVNFLDGNFSQVFPNNIYNLASKISTNTDVAVELHSQVASKVVGFAMSIPNDLSLRNSSQEIGKYWDLTVSKLNLISTTFSPLCIKEKGLPNFKQIFSQALQQAFTDSKDIFFRISQLAIENYAQARDNDDVQPLIPMFRFLKDSGLFEEFFLPLFIDSVIQFLQPIIDEIFQNELQTYLIESTKIKEHELNLAKPLITQNSLRQLEIQMNRLIFSSKLEQINNGLRPLIRGKDVKSVDICAKLARDTDTINNFTKELSFEFEAEAEECYKLLNPIQGIIELHNALVSFCKESFSQSQSRTLRLAFEKGFNTSLDTASRLLAEEIHHEFISRPTISQAVIDELIAVFRMLSNKDSFEAYHHLLLSRRILMLKAHIVHADEIFLAELRKQCGPEYTKRLDALFDDLHQSINMLQEFKAERSNAPNFFRALILSNDAWPNSVPSSARAPPAIEQILADFTNFIRTHHGKRKLQWNLRFTRVKMKAMKIGTLNEIRCSGLYAVFLLCFNGRTMITPDIVMKMTGLSSNEIDEICKILKSKKGGNLIAYIHQKIQLNINVSPENGFLSLPFAFPNLPHKENDDTKSAIMLNRNYQVDAAVMLVMKRERSMEKSDLKMAVKEILNFRLEDDLYEKRLQSLAKNIYLKLDASGRVHYLP